jgi:hypothetical protein
MESLERTEDRSISIFIPMAIKRRGGGSATIILPKTRPLLDKPTYDEKLIKACAKAYKWQQAMSKNNKLTVAALAVKENLTPAYVSRILRLNFIAPDVVKAIVDGRQPRDLKLQDFMSKEISDLWQEQKEMFGFM